MAIWAIIKSLTKQLIMVGIVIAISIAIMSVNQAAGIILMMIYSSWMVIKSSRKEMPLNKFTALLPGIMSLATFFIMLGLIGVQEETMPLIGVGLGIIPGFLMARGHKIYQKNGTVYAKRTFFYIFIWVVSMLFTQGSTLAGMREITDFGFLLNGFSTAMLVILSIILFLKTFSSQKPYATSTISSNLLFIFITLITISNSSFSSGTVHCSPGDELCCYTFTFNVSEGGDPSNFGQCISQGMSFNTGHGQSPNSFNFPNEDTVVAGAIVALMLLLTSLGLNAAQGVAGGAASAVGSATQEATSDDKSRDNDGDGYVRGTKMLDGDEAKEWMILHGYIKDDKRPELFQKDRLDDFKGSMPTEKAPGLQAWTGETDENGNMVGDYVILVDDEKVQVSQDDGNSNDDTKNDNSTANNSVKTDNDNDDNDNTSNEIESNDNKTTTFTDDSDDSNDTNAKDDKKTSDTSKQNTTKDAKDTKPETSKDETPQIDYSNVKEDLEKAMNEIIKDKIDDGYYVRNPTAASNAAEKYFEGNNKLHELLRIDPLVRDIIRLYAFGADQLRKGVNGSFGLLYEMMSDWKGGQCGEYAEWGAKWNKNKIHELYGRGTKIDKIVITSNAYSGSNHAATRITLPNGDKYILDYWEGIHDKKPAVYTEDEWVKKNHKTYNLSKKGSTIKYVRADTINAEQLSAGQLKKRIESSGSVEGKRLFLKHASRFGGKDLAAAKNLVLEWEKKSW